MNPKELRPVVAGLFTQGRRRTVRVAVEQELLVADSTTGAAVPIDRVRRAATAAIAAPYVSFEPGGQLELSLPCTLDPVAQVRTLTDDLQRHLAAAHISTYALPVDPRPEHEVPLQLTSPRYV